MLFSDKAELTESRRFAYLCLELKNSIMNIQRLLICLCVSFLTCFSSFAQGKVWSVEKARKWAEKKRGIVE